MKLLFVCTGNICRSPTAEAVFRHSLEQAGQAASFHIDSAGTQRYHVGEPPDHRAISTAASRGFDMTALRARAVCKEDFNDYDLILAMDAGHLRHLQRMRPKDSTATVELFLPYAGHPEISDVPDPYYGTQKDFEYMFNLIEAGAARMLHKLSQKS